MGGSRRGRAGRGRGTDQSIRQRSEAEDLRSHSLWKMNGGPLDAKSGVHRRTA